MNDDAPAILLQSLVWERVGVFSNRPGILTLADGTLSFRTQEGDGFHCPVSKVSNIKWPWYSFGAALNISVVGVKYRFSFIAPNGAGTAADIGQAADGLKAIVPGINAGKAWKSELVRQCPTS